MSEFLGYTIIESENGFAAWNKDGTPAAIAVDEPTLKQVLTLIWRNNNAPLDTTRTIFEDENRRRLAWDGLEELIHEAHDNAIQHGFYDDHYAVKNELIEINRNDLAMIEQRDFILSQLCKIAGEVGEAVAVVQNRETAKFDEELADIVIRTFDLAGFCCQQFQQTVLAKMEKNRGRPYKHGKSC